MVMSKVVKVTMSTASKPSFVQGRLHFFLQLSLMPNFQYHHTIFIDSQFPISPNFQYPLFFSYSCIFAITPFVTSMCYLNTSFHSTLLENKDLLVGVKIRLDQNITDEGRNEGEVLKRFLLKTVT